MKNTSPWKKKKGNKIINYYCKLPLQITYAFVYKILIVAYYLFLCSHDTCYSQMKLEKMTHLSELQWEGKLVQILVTNTFYTNISINISKTRGIHVYIYTYLSALVFFLSFSRGSTVEVDPNFESLAVFFSPSSMVIQIFSI